MEVDGVSGNGEHLDTALTVKVVNKDLAHNRKSQRSGKSRIKSLKKISRTRK
jgi:hypothetical protein